jgi:predicted GNAT family N-acyltransferase
MIHICSEEQLIKIPSMLKDAFANDPLHRWVFKNDFEFEQLSSDYWSAFIQWSFNCNALFVDHECQSASIWHPPESEEIDFKHMINLMMTLKPLDPPFVKTIIETFKRLDQFKPKRKYWHLKVLAVTKEYRNKGLAKQHIEHVTALSQTSDTPIYLEATSRINMEYYQKYQFKSLCEFSFPDGPSVFPMIRECSP